MDDVREIIKYSNDVGLLNENLKQMIFVISIGKG
jgi:hypothetical protein